MKVTFVIVNYKHGIHFSWWWFNRQCTFKMAAAVILDFENCWNFFSIWPIVTKISENIGTLIWNISLKSGMHIWKIQDGGRRHLEFRKTVAISLKFDQSTPNSVGILLLWFETHRWRQIINVTIIQDVAAAIWDFEKLLSFLFTIRPIVTKIYENIGTSIWNILMTSKIQSFENSRWRSPTSNLVGVLLLWFRTHPPSSWISKKCCHFITDWPIIIKFIILPIIAKFSRNIATLYLTHRCRRKIK